jgi:selenide,water dikinase
MTRSELVLVGGGHSQVEVLKRLGQRHAPDVHVTLISRDAKTPYSGMLPGVVAGHYAPATAEIDLAPLAQFARARFVQDEAVGLDFATRQVQLRRGPPVRFDLLSLNIGSTPNLSVPGAASHAVPVKPVDGFLAHWEAMHVRLRTSPSARRIGMTGGGAGGVEVLLSLWSRLEREAPDRFEYHLFTDSDGVLPGCDERFRRAVIEILRRRGVHVHTQGPVVEVLPHRVRTSDGTVHAVDEVLWATEASAPPWLAASGLAVDARGFVSVAPTLESVSHPHVFAAGDIASLVGMPLPKAGVYAVRQAPLLAGNLRRAAGGQALERYRPQRRILTLLSTGDRHAIASRGWLFVQGRWVWRWKDWIDRRFVAAYRISPSPDQGNRI